MKLFTIGDSISQGFMSFAAARTDLSYSSIIAKILGERNYNIPHWEKGGHPIDLEILFRKIQKKFGSDLNLVEWPLVVNTINKMMDDVEDYYEREGGRANLASPVNYWNNIAVRGYDVSDAYLLNSDICRRKIKKNGNRDNWWGIPGASFHRTALRVLNPSLKQQYMGFTALDWLKHHHTKTGVENLFLWLGANNVLSTVLFMNIKQTPGNLSKNRPFYFLEEKEREEWNLWHPDDFFFEYNHLLEEVDKIMQMNTGVDYRVFLGTIPYVSIAPLAKGVGRQHVLTLPHNGNQPKTYYEYYTYLPFGDKFTSKTALKLSLDQVLSIEECTAEYNRHIKSLASQKKNFVIVDLAEALSQMAIKRNNFRPLYNFPNYFKFIAPKPNTKYYGVNNRKEVTEGGIFSLDGVHPSAIGQGLIAWEFLKRLDTVRQTQYANKLDWQEIFDSDELYQNPIPVIEEFKNFDKLGAFVVEKFIPTMRK